MNDQSAGWFPPDDDDPEGDERRLRSDVERRLMDRARQAAERDREKPPARRVQQLLALAAALTLVALTALGFDAFLTSMQKVMRMMDEEEARQKQQQTQPEPARQPGPDEPIPAYVVPPD